MNRNLAAGDRAVPSLGNGGSLKQHGTHRLARRNLGSHLISLQYLRAFAAIIVVGTHTRLAQTELGSAGVDIFFVVSGFVMIMVGERAESPLAFLASRALRIVPLYWYVTLVQGIVDQVSLRHLGLSMAFWPHIDAQGWGLPVVIQGWTLVFEIFFYFIVSASLFAPAKFRVGGLCIALASLVLAGRILPPSNHVIQVYTSPLLLEFLAGVLLCQVWKRGWLPKGQGALISLCLGIGLLLAQVSLPVPVAWRVILWGVPAILIVAALLGLEAGTRLPLWPWLSAIGDASYAIYLTHGILVFELGLPRLVAGLPASIAIAILVLASIAAGLVVNKFVERPMAAWSKRQIQAVCNKPFVKSLK